MADDPVQVYVGRQIDAELIAANLQGHGIPALIQHSGASAAYPGMVGALGETRVFVAAERADEARALMGSGDVQSRAEQDLPVTPVRRTALRWIIGFVLIVIVATLLLDGLRTLVP